MDVNISLPAVYEGLGAHTMMPSAPAFDRTSAAQANRETSSSISSRVNGLGFPYVLLRQGLSCTSDAERGFGLRNFGTWRPGY